MLVKRKLANVKSIKLMYRAAFYQVKAIYYVFNFFITREILYILTLVISHSLLILCVDNLIKNMI